jgi:cysteine-rich repeat protein
VDEDACPSGAKGTCAAAKCGDGIVYAGMEECDGEEGCGESCEWMAECGNGAVEAGEACDDGNDVDEDACPSGAGGCKAEAKCGDGYVWAEMEGCDDGNVEDGDSCPSGAGACVAVASCGDGFVEVGVEGCDDKNDVDEDACPSGEGACMAAASCGDGFVEAGVEGCDDQNGEDLDECSNACAVPRWVFVTSGNGPKNNGNLGGIAGADAYCQGLADVAMLPGTYKAWLADSDPNSAPAMRFGSEAFTGWYRLRTNPPTGVAEGWADLTDANEDVPANYLRAAISVDEKGMDIGEGKVWTNTTPDGKQVDAQNHCESWTIGTSDFQGNAGRAKLGIVDSAWSVNSKLDCDLGVRLYCVQTD